MGAFKRSTNSTGTTPSVPPLIPPVLSAPKVRQHTETAGSTPSAPTPLRRRARRKNKNQRPDRSGAVQMKMAVPSSAPVTSPFSVHRSMTASASILDVSTAEARAAYTKRRSSASGWQEEAWAYFDSIGEIKYAFGLVANTLSRVRLYAGKVVDPALAPVSADAEVRAGAVAGAALKRLDSAFGGIPGLLRDAALNLQITGECNLVQVPSNLFKGTPESWDIRSGEELQISAEGTMVIYPTADQDAASAIQLPKGAFAARIWRPHPRWSEEPDSSMRGLLDSCAELLLLNKTFRSTARSRLNAGLLYLPDGLSVAAQADPDAPVMPDGDDPRYDPDSPEYDEELAVGSFGDGANMPGAVLVDGGDADDTDEIEEALIEAFTTPIADEESVSSVVPLLLRGPAELGEKIRLIQFERPFDPALATRADRVLDRIMQGLDVPKDIVQGLSNIKYSNAVVIDQSLYTSHIEPLALLICDALTNVYLHPSMRAAGVDEQELKDYVIWYDATDVTTRPNKADDAQEGFQNYAISMDTWRRTHNFTDADAPTPNEVALRMLIDKGPLTPELSEALLSVVAPDIMKAVREASQASAPTPMDPEVAEALGMEVPDAGGADSAQSGEAPAGEEQPAPQAEADQGPTDSGQPPAEEPGADDAEPVRPEELL